MKIDFTNFRIDGSHYFAPDYQLTGQDFEFTCEVQPTPPLRIKGLNTFQTEYVRNEEIRTAIRIKD
jgi:hypothetical protein